MQLCLFLLAVVVSSCLGDNHRCPKDQVGTCEEECSEENRCTGGQVCCSNSCGHACMDPVEDDDEDNDEDDDDDDECKGGQIRNSCGSPCPATCDEPDPICAQVCEDRCECPRNASISHMGQCIVQSMCPSDQGVIDCDKGLDLAFSECGSACVRTCATPNPPCTRQCVQRCQCSPETLWHNGKCIAESECPSEEEEKCWVGEPLEDVFCGRGENRENCPDDYSCVIDPTDRFAVCCPRGMCPKPLDGSPCGAECTDDSNCSDGQLCCDAGSCGKTCMAPVEMDEDSDEDDEDDEDEGKGCNFRELSQVVRDVIDAVRNGQSDPAELVQYLGEIARTGCLDRLSKLFKVATCNVDQFTQAVCEVHDIKVVKAFQKCLPSADRCAALTRIYKTEEAQCIRDSDLSLVAELFVSADCVVPIEAVLLLPQGLMLKYIKSLSESNLEDFVDALVDSAPMVQLLSCSKKKMLIKTLLDIDVARSISNFTAFMPYLPKDACIRLISNAGSQLVSNLEGIKMMMFECAGSDNFYGMLESALHKHDVDLFRYLMYSQLGESGTTMSPAEMMDMPDKMTLTFSNRIFLTMYQLNQADSDCKFECGRVIAEKAVELLAASDIQVDINNARDKLGNLAECLDTRKLISNVDVGDCSGLSMEVLTELEPKELKDLATRCLATRQDYNYTDAELKGLGCLILYVKPSILRKLNGNQLCSLMSGDLFMCLDGDIIRSVTPSIVQYLRQECEAIDAIATKLQPLQRGLQQRRNESAEQNMEDAEAEKKKGNKAKARLLNFLAGEKLIGSAITSDEEVARNVPSQKLKEKLKKENVNITDLDVSGTTKQQRRALLDLYLELKGLTLEELEEEDLEDIKELLRGLNYQDLPKVCQDRPAMCIQIVFQQLVDGDLPFGGKIVKKITELLIRMLILEAALEQDVDIDEVGPSDYMLLLSASEVDRLIPEVLRHITLEQLMDASADAVEAILWKLAQDTGRSCGELMDAERMQQAKFALENFGEGDGGNTATEDHIEIASLLLDADNIAFSADFLNNGGPVAIGACPFCVPPSLADKLISSLQDLDTVDYESLGCWIPSLYRDDLSSDDKDMIMDLVWENREEIKDAMMCSEDSEVMCQLSSLDEDAKARVAEVRQQVVEALRDAAEREQLNVEENMGEARKKRTVHRTRRAASMYLCQTLQAMDSSSLVEVLSEENIEAMDDDEFLDCIRTLGQVSGWAESQPRLLFTKSLVVLDTTACSLTDATLSDLGTIAYSLTLAEIGCLNLDLDMVTTLGQLSMWSSEQLTALASRFLGINNIAPADFTSDELVAVGHILCGLDDTEIKTLSPAVYGAATTVIGTLETAPVSCLQSLVSVATHGDAHGPLSGWTGVTYSDIGIVLGGLTGEQLKAADADDYTGFQGNGIRHLPAEELNKLDPEDFEQLSRAQLLEITEDQRDELSEELDGHLDCLLEEECEDDDDGGDNGDDGGDNGDDGVITGVAGMAASVCTLISAYMVTLMW